MEIKKIVKTRRSYEADFKQEVIGMLISGKIAKEISDSFGIAENLLYRWKRMATMKTKTKIVRLKAVRQRNSLLELLSCERKTNA